MVCPYNLCRRSKGISTLAFSRARGTQLARPVSLPLNVQTGVRSCSTLNTAVTFIKCQTDNSLLLPHRLATMEARLSILRIFRTAHTLLVYTTHTGPTIPRMRATGFPPKDATGGRRVTSVLRSTTSMATRASWSRLQVGFLRFLLAWHSEHIPTAAYWLDLQSLRHQVPAQAQSQFRHVTSFLETTMKTRYLATIIVGCLFLAGPLGLAQQQPNLVSLIQIIASPEKFDGRLVTAQGLLVLGEHPEFVGQQPILYVHDEDARNQLFANAVWITPSDQMRHDREKIDRMYVTITGLFHASHSDSDHFVPGTITQIQTCTVQSDPNHPIGLKGNNTKYK